MASFNIHEDQENLPSLRPNKAVLGHVQPKRAVLGTLDNRPERLFAGKQGSSQHGGLENVQSKKFGGKGFPTVPVAQFEAFKVYEDHSEKTIREPRQRRNKELDIYSNVYKGTEEDRFMTKKEVKEMAARLQQHASLSTVEDRPVLVSSDLDRVMDSPMSIEKVITDTMERNEQNDRTNKEQFFKVPEYRNQILSYLRERETLNRAKPGYMRKQPDITHNMRSILVDWLVEVAQEYKLHTETLYLAVNYIDRFLSYMSVVRAKLQLVGTAAMFIAAKYEEIYPPDVGEFVYITDDTYNKRQVTRMEILILRILDFELSIPTPYTFITAMAITNDLPDNVMYLAMYISELSLLEAEPTLELLPSAIAGSAIAIANHTLSDEPWSDSLTETTGYELKDLEDPIAFLWKMYLNASSMQQQAIQSKYKSEKYLHVSEIAPRSEPIKF